MMPNLSTIIPALEWIPAYRLPDLYADLKAGAVVAVVLAPQAMAYALLAGLPPIIGLYSATLPLLAYALFGSSRHLAVGPVAMVSLLVQVTCSKVAQPGDPAYVMAALQLAFLAGLIQVGLGFVKAGSLVNFLSQAAIGGFTSAAALIIALSQLQHLLGVHSEGVESAMAMAGSLWNELGKTHLLTLALGCGAIVLLVAMHRFYPRFPAPLLVVAAGTLLVAFLHLDHTGVKTVGDLPRGLPPFSLPDLSISGLVDLLPAALTIALIGYLESFAVAKMISVKDKYRIHPNHELTGLGAANLAASLFSGYPVTGGFSRTAVNRSAGARTNVASLVTALLIGVTLIWFTHLFFYLPKAVLAAIVIVAVAGLVEIAEARYLFHVRTSDGLTFVLTFLATLVFGVEGGIIAGVVFSLLVFIWRSSHPHIAELGWLPKESVFRNMVRYPNAKRFPGVLLLRVDASLYFANMAFVEDRLREELSGRPEVHYVVFDLSGVNDVDAVALEAMERIIENLSERGVTVAFAGMKGPVRDMAAKAGWKEKYSRRISYMSLLDALEGKPVQAAGERKLS